MARVKKGLNAHKRHKKVLKMAKGYYGAKSKTCLLYTSIYLKKLAHQLDPTVYIGKAGVTDNIKKEMETGFESRELVKVRCV